MKLVTVADIALAREPRDHLVGSWLWIAPGGLHFAYPTEGFVHVHGLDGVAQAAIVLPADARLPERRDFHGDVVAGLQAGALHPSGRRIAMATHERLVLLDAEHGQLAERSLFDAGGDDDDGWFGDPGALAFSADGALLWFATTHADGIARMYGLDAATLASRGQVDLVEFPPPGDFELAVHPTRHEVLWTVACGQDGGGFARVALQDGALVAGPTPRWVADRHFFVLGFRPDGCALVLAAGQLETQDGAVLLASQPAGGTHGALVGAQLLIDREDREQGGGYHVLDATSFSAQGELDPEGGVFALASGRVIITRKDSLRIATTSAD
ncbi:MAG: hypothetical protein IT370_11055 [Deltaproteobacteria bacterium]|nr:hypothetical protein [Deltaproteobacteria bacterium]